MRYLRPPGKDAAFHFSAEAYFMEQFPLTEPIFMIWQADRCAMLGSYQVAEAEVDLRYASENSIRIVRRQSGGGTIFTDMGTLLCTLILPEVSSTDPQTIMREDFAAPIARALRQLGISAEMKGRNDILVAGKKVCGIAQHMRNGRICTHGSLLCNTDLDMLAAVLRTDAAKIQSKAIPSVRSRVTNLREHMPRPVSTTDFWTLLEEKLAEIWDMRPYALTAADLAAIADIHHTRFGNPDWTRDRSPRFSFRNGKRFPGGRVEVFLDIVRGNIAAATICGDFLGVVPIRGLEAALEGQVFQREAIVEVLTEFDLRPYLGDVARDAFLSCMFE